jgi:hypothetical protein
MTRTSTGKLPQPRQLDIQDSSSPRIVHKISSSEVKEKMELQLRQQREMNNKKRIEDLSKGKKSKLKNSKNFILNVN